MTQSHKQHFSQISVCLLRGGLLTATWLSQSAELEYLLTDLWFRFLTCSRVGSMQAGPGQVGASLLGSLAGYAELGTHRR